MCCAVHGKCCQPLQYWLWQSEWKSQLAVQGRIPWQIEIWDQSVWVTLQEIYIEAAICCSKLHLYWLGYVQWPRTLALPRRLSGQASGNEKFSYLWWSRSAEKAKAKAKETRAANATCEDDSCRLPLLSPSKRVECSKEGLIRRLSVYPCLRSLYEFIGCEKCRAETHFSFQGHIISKLCALIVHTVFRTF